MDTTSLLNIGTRLQNGRYTIEQPLSSGGFGNTYLAYDKNLEEHVAIKEFFMKGDTHRGPDSLSVMVSNDTKQSLFDDQRKKFRKEAQRIRELNNPHIVRVHDLFDENNTSYYVMDFIDGQSLLQLLKKRQGPMTEAEVRAMLPQILNALQEIHKHGIYHLDLKPANIMTDKHDVVKLIDFGASKQLGVDGQGLTSTAMCYTPGYAPSEQIERNYSKVGPWTDFYALGATLYHVLTCHIPPSISDLQDQLTAIRKDEDVKPLFLYPDGLSFPMRNLIEWMMHPTRTERPQNMDDLKRRMKQWDGKWDQAINHHSSVDDDEDSDITVIDSDHSRASGVNPLSCRHCGLVIPPEWNDGKNCYCWQCGKPLK